MTVQILFLIWYWLDEIGNKKVSKFKIYFKITIYLKNYVMKNYVMKNLCNQEMSRMMKILLDSAVKKAV